MRKTRSAAMHRSAHVDSFTRDSLPPAAQWPDLLLQSADVQYPARINAAVELVDRMIERGHGEAIALRNDEASCTWRQLAAQVNRIASVLRTDLGLVPGNRVLLRGGNHPMMAACWLAVVKAGLVAVATMPLLRAKELVEVIDKAQIGAALCDAALAQEMALAGASSPVMKTLAWFNTDGTEPADALPILKTLRPGLRSPDLRNPGLRNPGLRSLSLEASLAQASADFTACDTAQDDVALIAFTSGTTGKPKGTMHFHRDVLAMCDLFPRHILKPAPEDIFCGTPPLAFTFGLGGMLCFALRAGASTVLLERLTPQALLAAVARHRATVMFTAPTFYRQMAPLAKDYDLRSLLKCVSAGEALAESTRAMWREATGIELIDGIGSTEMIHIFISSSPGERSPGAIGKPVPGYEARIVDEAMQPVPAGTVGRLAVRGPTGCRYLADERQRQYVRDGWNLTGDSFLMDEAGFFHYQARNDDLIVSAGYNIAGPEVESALLSHPAVAECGVIGAPDEARGQIVKAFVVLREGFTPDQAMAKVLQDHVKAAIAPYKYPRAVVFVPSLPRTETGKLQRFRLREL
jgi:2-aminobenzoate-CoA ligase